MWRGISCVMTAALVAAAPASAAKEPRVLYRSTVGGDVALPAAACAGAAEGLKSDAAPLIGAVPGKEKELRAVYQAHGERLHLSAASHDGGRTWTREAIPSATQCLSDHSERNLSANPLFDVGAGGAAYLGESWFNNPSEDADMWRFGVTVHRLGAGDVAPTGGAETSQNAAVAADPKDPDHVSVLWTFFNQIPNPVTYTPTPNELRFSESYDGGRTWSEPVVVYRASAPEVIINGRMARASDGSLVVLFDRANLRDFPTAQFGLSGAPLEVYSTRSTDGRVWSAPVHLGTGFLHNSASARPEGESGDGFLIAAKPDLATGPKGAVVAMWNEKDSDTVRIARSRDAGRTWSLPQDTVRLQGDAFNAAAAIDGQGRVGLFFYDFREDRAGDGAFTVQPRLAISGRRGWEDVAVDEPFDLDRTETCEQVLPVDPVGFTMTCNPGSHAGALGVYQDVEGLRKGFGVGYTVGPPLARDGFTDARYARVAASEARRPRR